MDNKEDCEECEYCGDEGVVMTYDDEWIDCIFCCETSDDDDDSDYDPANDSDCESDDSGVGGHSSIY